MKFIDSCVYIIKRSGEFLYIGVTSDSLSSRIAQHIKKRIKVRISDHITFASVPTQDIAKGIESYLINLYQPLCNKLENNKIDVSMYSSFTADLCWKPFDSSHLFDRS